MSDIGRDAVGAHAWRLAHGRSLSLDRARILAILNITPDSFSDGGRFADAAQAAEAGFAAVEAGADGLDIGGESTRPGATPVSEAEQIARVVPVIERLRTEGFTAPISVDTTRAAVARAALDAGADIINDQSAGLDDPAMLRLVAQRGAGVALMHRLAPSHADSYSDRYARAPQYEGGVVCAVRAFLAERAMAAERAGVARDGIVLDPGLGFGKTVAQNFEVIAGTAQIAALGYPVLAGASRKSFIGKVSGVEAPPERVFGTVGASVAQRLGGAMVFRVHDVAAHAQALAVADAVAGAAATARGRGHKAV